MPDGRVPRNAVPNDAVPDNAVPDNTMPDNTVPNDAVPDKTVPGGGPRRRLGAGPIFRVLPPVGWARRVARTAGSGLGGTGSAYLLERNARVYRHVWLLFVSGLAEPLFYLLSLGIGLGPLVGHVTGPGGAVVPYREFVAPGLLAVSAMNGAIYDSTFNVFFKIKYVKLYDAILATPMRPADVALGEIAWALLRGGVYAVAFMTVMAAMGLVHSYWALLGVPIALLVSFAFAATGMACTTFMRSWQDFDYVLLASLPLFLFSATFYPLSVYPRPVAIIVEWTPLYQGVVLLRNLVLGVAGPGLLWRAAYLAAMGLIGLAIASRRIGSLLLT
jgi:lipooligosaccharide transport system permease protein